MRLKEEKDQTKNILAAVQTALPVILCPLIRSNINDSCIKSLDLTVLRKLSECLGKHGRIAYKKYFLDPEINNDLRISELIQKLVKLDNYGIFVPIFINELEQLSEILYSQNDKTDYTNEVISFIEYLLSIANRDRGESIELKYLIQPFKVSIILLASAERADKQSLKPYLRRMEINVEQGSESIYVISFPPAFHFFDRLIHALESHERVFVKKTLKTSSFDSNENVATNLKIAVLYRNDIYNNVEFEQRLEANEIRGGIKVKGIVEDVSKNESLVTINGMRAYILKQDCAWNTLYSCDEILIVGQELEFLVKRIDHNESQIYLTLKFQENNPWNLVVIPQINELINVNLISHDNVKFTCLYDNKYAVFTSPIFSEIEAILSRIMVVIL